VEVPVRVTTGDDELERSDKEREQKFAGLRPLQPEPQKS
jgi:hypothetical protein